MSVARRRGPDRKTIPCAGADFLRAVEHHLLRTGRPCTKTWIAEASGLSKRQLQRWAKGGARDRPTWESAGHIAEAIGVRLEDLIDDAKAIDALSLRSEIAEAERLITRRDEARREARRMARALWQAALRDETTLEPRGQRTVSSSAFVFLRRAARLAVTSDELQRAVRELGEPYADRLQRAHEACRLLDGEDVIRTFLEEGVRAWNGRDQVDRGDLMDLINSFAHDLITTIGWPLGIGVDPSHGALEDWLIAVRDAGDETNPDLEQLLDVLPNQLASRLARIMDLGRQLPRIELSTIIGETLVNTMGGAEIGG
jgi:transcriptional regulator with XRE-family HTH domain